MGERYSSHILRMTTIGGKILLVDRGHITDPHMLPLLCTLRYDIGYLSIELVDK